jgi:putative ABC transport system ATP-binding protein
MFVEKTAGFEERGDSVIDGADLMIEAAGVQKVYEAGGLRVRALRGVDLGIARGEMVAIMGPSGCGKTTLLNVLSGLDDLSDGEVLVDGDSIGGMSDRRRTRFRAEKMGFIFQSYNLIPVLSAVENVELPLLVAGKKQKKARRWALDALEMVGLPEQANKRPSEMSGGQQQRVTVARSLVNNPSIVWADEPTGALDSETSKGIMDLLVRLNGEQRQTFVLVTHDAAVAARAHRTILMRDGNITSDEQNGRGE